MLLTEWFNAGEVLHFPTAIIDVTDNGKSYTINKDGRNFIVKIVSCSFYGDRQWFESLVISVNIQ